MRHVIVLSTHMRSSSLRTYLFGAHFLPICIILAKSNTSSYMMLGHKKTHLQHSSLYHDLHTVWRNPRYLIYRILEHGWGLIGIELDVVDLSGVLNLHSERRHYLLSRVEQSEERGEEEGTKPPFVFAKFCVLPGRASHITHASSHVPPEPRAGSGGEKGKVPADGRPGRTGQDDVALRGRRGLSGVAPPLARSCPCFEPPRFC